jgi:hypothetical protein
MALMSFLDTILVWTDVDWNTWGKKDLIDQTTAKRQRRIAPAMVTQLIKVELDPGKHCSHWSSVQRTFKLFSVFSQAVAKLLICLFLNMFVHFPTHFRFPEQWKSFGSI